MSDAPQPDANGIYAESGFRLPLPRNESGDPEVQKLFDAADRVANDPARGKSGAGTGLRGPGGIMLYSPQHSRLASDLNMYLRFNSGIDGRTRQLAILIALRELNHQYAWTYHEGASRREGLEPEVIDVVAYRKPVDGLAEKDGVLIMLGRQAITEGYVTRETFDAAHRIFGAKMMVDLLGLMGSYLSTGITMTAFDMQLRDDWVPSLPKL